MFRKLMTVFTSLLIILQIVSAFILDSPITAVIGCLAILIAAIQWEFKGGMFTASLCSVLMLLGYFTNVMHDGNLTIITITIFLYYIMGVGIGSVVGSMRKQRNNLIISEEKNKSLISDLATEKERLNVTLGSIGDGVIATDNEGNIVIINKVACELTGWDKNDAMGKTIQEIFNIVNKESGVNSSTLASEVLQKGNSIKLDRTTMLVSKNGTERNILDCASPIKDVTDNTLGMVVVFRDNTELKKAEDALKLSEEKYSSYINNAPDGVFVTDEKGRYIEVNKASSMITGYSKDELLGMSIRDITAKESEEEGLNHFLTLLKTGFSDGELQYKHKNGSNRWWTVDAVKLTEHRFLGFVKDITYQKNAEEQILYFSYRDQLTELYNRRFYEEELKRLDTKRNLPLTIVMGDINGLKLINDSFGHTIGDELLRKSAEVIKKGCRADDIIARLGGDEFVIILPKTDNLEAEKLIKRIQDLSREEKVGGIDISISFGYETKDNEEEKIQEIFNHAEESMYRNKRTESSSARSKTIDLVMNSLFEKSNREQLHSVKVSNICEAIATKMNLSRNDVYQIRIAGLMHDIGKIEINEKILNKPEKLNRDEWEEMQRHPEIGYRILSSMNEFSVIANDVLEHHERWDGKGYPRGLRGEECSVHARIITIADTFDAMTNDRTYDSKVKSEEEAIKEIRQCSGTQFDPDIARIFIEKVLGKEW